ncbi:unnamed protein product [Arabidopsis halleri]
MGLEIGPSMEFDILMVIWVDGVCSCMRRLVLTFSILLKLCPFMRVPCYSVKKSETIYRGTIFVSQPCPLNQMGSSTMFCLIHGLSLINVKGN